MRTLAPVRPQNELVRHVFFILLLSEHFAFDGTPYLVIAFVLNTISMSLPRPLPFMIRRLTKSATAVTLVNVSLLLAWLLPVALPIIAHRLYWNVPLFAWMGPAVTSQHRHRLWSR